MSTQSAYDSHIRQIGIRGVILEELYLGWHEIFVEDNDPTAKNVLASGCEMAKNGKQVHWTPLSTVPKSHRPLHLRGDDYCCDTKTALATVRLSGPLCITADGRRGAANMIRDSHVEICVRSQEVRQPYLNLKPSKHAVDNVDCGTHFLMGNGI